MNVSTAILITAGSALTSVAFAQQGPDVEGEAFFLKHLRLQVRMGTAAGADTRGPSQEIAAHRKLDQG